MDIVELQAKIDKLNENKAIAERELTFVKSQIADELNTKELVKRDIDISRAELAGFKDKLSENSKAIGEVVSKKAELESKLELIDGNIKEKAYILNDVSKKIELAKAELKDIEVAKCKALSEAEILIADIAGKVLESNKKEIEAKVILEVALSDIEQASASLAKMKEELADVNEKRIGEFKKCEIAESNRVMIEKEIAKMREDSAEALKTIELAGKEKEEAKKMMAEAKAVRLRMEEKAKKAGL